jgi:hypothetical protein
MAAGCLGPLRLQNVSGLYSKDNPKRVGKLGRVQTWIRNSAPLIGDGSVEGTSSQATHDSRSSSRVLLKRIDRLGRRRYSTPDVQQIQSCCWFYDGGRKGKNQPPPCFHASGYYAAAAEHASAGITEPA